MLHASMAEHMRWARLSVSIQEIAEDNTDLVRDLATYNRASTVPLLAGLLTLPDYQSNCIRLEILVALAVRYCHGRKRAHVEQAKDWFLQIGNSRCVLGEDPAEDIFVSLVHDDRGNYRLLEGVWQGAGFYTQRVFDVVARMPDDEEFRQIKNRFRALLIISDMVCDKAQLQRYQLGSDARHSTLLSHKLPSGKALTSRVTVTFAELNDRGIARSDIEPFLLQSHMVPEMDAQQIAGSHLDRHPLVMYEDTSLVVALPSALSIAMRNYVIRQIEDRGLAKNFDEALAENYLQVFADLPLFGGPTDLPVLWKTVGEHRWSHACFEFDKGYCISIHLFLPSVQAHGDAGFKDEYELDGLLMEQLRRSVDEVYSHFAKQSNFNGGIVVVVGCGWGKGWVTEEFKVERPKWYFQDMSADDLHRLSRLGDMKPDYFWRIQDGLEAVTTAGVAIYNVNGILNLIGWVRQNSGHFVPHEELPDGAVSLEQPLLLTPPLNLLRDVRAAADRGYDRHRACDNTGRWHDVQRSSANPFFVSDSSRRVYMSMDALRQGGLTSVYEGAVHLWISVSTPSSTRRDLTYGLWEMACEWLHRIGAALDGEVGSTIDHASLKVYVEFRDADPSGDLGPKPAPEALARLGTIENHSESNARIVVFLARDSCVAFELQKTWRNGYSSTIW